MKPRLLLGRSPHLHTYTFLGFLYFTPRDETLEESYDKYEIAEIGVVFLYAG